MRIAPSGGLPPLHHPQLLIAARRTFRGGPIHRGDKESHPGHALTARRREKAGLGGAAVQAEPLAQRRKQGGELRFG
jgi:hypothetical protein